MQYTPQPSYMELQLLQLFLAAHVIEHVMQIVLGTSR